MINPIALIVLLNYHGIYGFIHNIDANKEWDLRVFNKNPIPARFLMNPNLVIGIGIYSNVFHAGVFTFRTIKELIRYLKNLQNNI